MVKSISVNIIKVECCEGDYILTLNAAGRLIYESCNDEIGTLDDLGINFIIRSNPCHEPGHGLVGGSYTKIWGVKK